MILENPCYTGYAIYGRWQKVGALRVTAELNDGDRAGQRMNHKRAARVMRGHGIRGYQRKRRVRTTIPELADQKVPELLKRD